MSAVPWSSATTWPAARAALVALSVLAATLGCQRSEPPPAPSAPTAPLELTFAGAAKCAGCHPKEAEAHRGSDHALAMQPANQQTVLGDFRDAVFRHRGVTSTFLRRDGKFLVRTDGPDGKPGEFEIAYTFGVKPLQQYLIPLAGGRLQAFSLAWDTRPKAEGGQRWMHLLPGETLRPPDPLHWTGRGTTSARNVTRPISGRTTTGERTSTRPPGARSTSRAKRATGPGRPTWPGRRRVRLAHRGRLPGPPASSCGSGAARGSG